MWPEVSLEEARAWSFLRAAGAGVSSIMFAILLALTPAKAFGQSSSSSSLHAGSVEIHDPVEQSLFNQLRCMCGGCARLPLSGCVCSTAESTRAEIRAKLRGGITPDQIISEYVHDYGAASLSVPPNRGALRAIYMVPVAAAVAGFGLLFTVVRRWKRQGDLSAPPLPAGGPIERDEYDTKLDEELKKLE
jgi:cytochrome c-type biogenesis protein CcmH/NrfF